LNQFDPEHNLCLNDIQITDECVFIRLNRSKTNPFRQGIVISTKNCLVKGFLSLDKKMPQCLKILKIVLTENTWKLLKQNK
jgi:hypothetical protein